jgi:dTDP-4-dehydrorhamnose reductase
MGALFITHKPAIVINCVAYTDLDKSETTDQKKATVLNYKFPEYLARKTKAFNSKLIHFSTNHVFNGDSVRPYIESDPTNPINFYGKTKQQGEEAVLREDPNSLILRIGDIYDEQKSGLISNILKNMKSTGKLLGFAERTVCPTSTSFVANVIKSMIVTYGIGNVSKLKGVYHVSPSGFTSSLNFITELAFLLSSKYQTKMPQIIPTMAESDTRPAKRPLYGVMNPAKMLKTVAYPQRDWKSGLTDFIQSNAID